ncbi:transporter, CPA2 family [Gleimia coleocanis DSM 15436]|uniref:Transporter, CPA2 family n=1 Tax=Gleimia coleocanis DSM 15436 TaxID=525245 RepID=C0W1I4_9ACTO|nr:cation:proton antiporter [Gleimia coleocanis]EEH63350.1 transporter, CPA2 family [Gleimia coleocanis DSM 15436]
MTEFSSLFVVSVISVLAPLLAYVIPKRIIPETVLLVVMGMLAGPYVLGFIELSDSIKLLTELGLAFLFLLAGYEIEVKELKGKRGKAALIGWLATFAIAFTMALIIPNTSGYIEQFALAIAFSATALGTLIPILKERGLIKTNVGLDVLAHGTFGELGPILAMALLLSVRSPWETVLILALFFAVSIVMAIIPVKARAAGSKLVELIHLKSETTAQTTVRVTVMVMVSLVLLAYVFDLDVVLGAFAAGFIIRIANPAGREELEQKLDGLAFGFLIPLFFITSGASINVGAVLEAPFALILVVFGLLAARAVPVYFSTYFTEDAESYTSRDRLTVALYSTTSLPIIVAVTHVATETGTMGPRVASILIAGGALSVLLMPLLASISYKAADAHPIDRMSERLRRFRSSRPVQNTNAAKRKIRKR